MSATREFEDALRAAADAVRSADALLIGAGAGMGVDSGLPDFRGDAGFWKAYPPFQGRSFASMSNPRWFDLDPTLAWGFFGHRLKLYRHAIPHAGFSILHRWASNAPRGYFVFTSNVDGQFQRSGFPEQRVMECHGSIHFLQCTHGCESSIWSAADLELDIDETSIRCRSEFPKCLHCHRIARPNILMFGDSGWLANRSEIQYSRYKAWLQQVSGTQVVAIELGAGLAIPTVRHECEHRSNVLIRINPRESEGAIISLPLGALDALSKIDEYMQEA